MEQVMVGYALRYYKEYGLNGHPVRLEIWKKYPSVEYAPAPKEIGKVLQGLSIDLQGDMDDVITPIVKTSLSITLADAPHLNGKKRTTGWEEFYTPDSTGYKVLLYIDGAIYWSGYITPDSFEEELEYCGSVSLTARDNIGHLQDFLFDDKGNNESMISVRDIISKSWQKADCLLSLEYATGEWAKCEGYNALDCLVNVEAFEEKTWYDALEAVLDSFGLALRFIGNNRAVVMPLRSIPLIAAGIKDVILQSAGHRSLMRAAKEITDVNDYDIQRELIVPNVNAEDFSENSSVYRCKIDGDNFSRPEHDAPIWSLKPSTNPSARLGWCDNLLADTLFFDVSKYPLGYFLAREQDDISIKGKDVMYIAANNVGDRKVEFRQRISCRPIAIDMHFAEPLGLTNAGNLERYYNLRLHKIVYQLLVFNDSIGEKCWDGSKWTSYDADIEVAYDVNANVNQFTTSVNFNDLNIESAVLTFRIKRIEYYAVGSLGVPDMGVYARLQKLVLRVPDDVTIMEKLTIKSVYDKTHNHLICRNCFLVAQEQAFAFTKVVKNGIFLPNEAYSPAAKWKWGDEAGTYLSALIAQQILMYYSQPNSIITGTLVAKAGEVLNVGNLWRWKGQKLILVSGQLDLMTGFITGAKLRQFKEWEALYPEEGLLIAENGVNYVTSEDGDKVKVAKIYYNLVSEIGDYVKS